MDENGWPLLCAHRRRRRRRRRSGSDGLLGRPLLLTSPQGSQFSSVINFEPTRKKAVHPRKTGAWLRILSQATLMISKAPNTVARPHGIYWGHASEYIILGTCLRIYWGMACLRILSQAILMRSCCRNHYHHPCLPPPPRPPRRPRCPHRPSSLYPSWSSLGLSMQLQTTHRLKEP